ncbi:MAG TPA: hypothetical protein VIS27_08645, partial [Yeosuana sp.]
MSLRILHLTGGGNEARVNTIPTIITLTSGTTWSVPNDWNYADIDKTSGFANKVECYGGGGGGERSEQGTNNRNGGGGGGGAYSNANNVVLTAGSTIDIAIGAGGAGGTTNGEPGDPGGDTCFD